MFINTETGFLLVVAYQIKFVHICMLIWAFDRARNKKGHAVCRKWKWAVISKEIYHQKANICRKKIWDAKVPNEIRLGTEARNNNHNNNHRAFSGLHHLGKKGKWCILCYDIPIAQNKWQISTELFNNILLWFYCQRRIILILKDQTRIIGQTK